MRIAKLLPVLIALLLALGSHLVASQEVIPPLQQPQRLNITVVVNDVSLKLKVYPDGSVQTVYKLDALIKGLKAEGLKLDYEAAKRATSSKLESHSTLDLLIPDSLLRSEEKGYRVNITPFTLSLRLDASYEQGPGFHAKGELELRLQNETMSVALNGPFEVRLTPRAGFSITASIKATNVDPEKVRKFARALDALLDNLTREGLLSSKSVRFRVEGGNPVLEIEIEGSLAKLLSALALTVSPQDIAVIVNLLQEEYGIHGESRVSLVAGYKRGDGLRVHMESRGEATGRIEKYMLDSARASNALQRILLGVLSYALRAQGVSIPLSALYLSSSQKPLAEKPPFEAHVEIHAEGGDEGLKLEVEYTGAKQIYAYPTHNPEMDAKETLGILARSISQTAASLRVLELVVPGISGVVPGVVEIEGEDGVSVAPEKVPVEQLESVTFTVRIGEAATSTAPETTTSQPVTESPTSTTSTTSPATPTTSVRSVAGTPAATGVGGGGTMLTIVVAVVAALIGAGVAYMLARR